MGDEVHIMITTRQSGPVVTDPPCGSYTSFQNTPLSKIHPFAILKLSIVLSFEPMMQLNKQIEFKMYYYKKFGLLWPYLAFSITKKDNIEIELF